MCLECVCVCLVRVSESTWVCLECVRGPETRSGTVQSLKCCPCQQKRAARLKSAAPGSIKGGGPETRSGTVQSLKCCPCQQKRAARLESAAPGSGGPRNALGHRPEPEVLPLPAETSREAPKCCAWQHRGGGPRTRSGTVQSLKPRGSKVLRLAASRGGPRNALGHRPEPEVLPLPAETSREAQKCCAPANRNEPRGSKAAPGSIEGGGPETRSGSVQSLKCCPCQQKRAARLKSAASGSIEEGAPKRARAPSRA